MNFEDRIVEYPHRYKQIPVAGTTDTFDMQPVTGKVTSQGTPVNKALMEGVYDEISRGVATDLERYYGNTLLISDFQDISEWTVSQGRLQATTNTKKIGNQAINITSLLNGGSYPYIDKSVSSITNLYNGDTISEDDYIYVIYVIPDTTKIGTTVELSLFKDDYSVRYQYNLKNQSFKMGWNYARVRVGDMSSIGGITGLDEVNNVRFLFHVPDTSEKVTIAVQLIQFIKKSPYGDYPSPFGEDAALEQTANGMHWFVGMENNKIVCKNLNQSTSNANGIMFKKEFKEFETVYKYRLWSSYNYVSTIMLYINGNNYINWTQTATGEYSLRTIVDGRTTLYPFDGRIETHEKAKIKFVTKVTLEQVKYDVYVDDVYKSTCVIDNPFPNMNYRVFLPQTVSRLIYLDSLSITNIDATHSVLSPSTQNLIGANNVDAGIKTLYDKSVTDKNTLTNDINTEKTRIDKIEEITDLMPKFPTYTATKNYTNTGGSGARTLYYLDLNAHPEYRNFKYLSMRYTYSYSEGNSEEGSIYISNNGGGVFTAYEKVYRGRDYPPVVRVGTLKELFPYFDSALASYKKAFGYHTKFGKYTIMNGYLNSDDGTLSGINFSVVPTQNQIATRLTIVGW